MFDSNTRVYGSGIEGQNSKNENIVIRDKESFIGPT